ncbi:MAG: hypothetical protein LCH88_08960 [Proteobacteria bacterium]|nr:hypothetical protein [Pseudomonadota bacterium]
MSETLWGRVFRKWVRKGHDHGDAAYRADEAMNRYTRGQDRRGYDRNGPEVAALHQWFATNGESWKWHDDGCRSEQARDLLNHLAKAGLIIVPVPRKDTP